MWRIHGIYHLGAGIRFMICVAALDRWTLVSEERRSSGLEGEWRIRRKRISCFFVRFVLPQESTFSRFTVPESHFRLQIETCGSAQQSVYSLLESALFGLILSESCVPIVYLFRSSAPTCNGKDAWERNTYWRSSQKHRCRLPLFLDMIGTAASCLGLNLIQMILVRIK